MTLTPEGRRAVGDAWGRLAGVVVDACKSHHECHCAEVAAQEKHAQREANSINVDKTKCVSSAGETKYETTIAIAPSTTDLYLAVAHMNLLAPGKAVAATSIGASPEPDHVVASQQTSRVKVLVEAVTPPGLYIGHVGPPNGGDPRMPVLIFVDGMD
jgi:hypothetical protein